MAWDYNSNLIEFYLNGLKYTEGKFTDIQSPDLFQISVLNFYYDQKLTIKDDNYTWEEQHDSTQSFK